MSSLKVVECVPNFSEGCNKETLDAISKAIKSTEGCTLLDVDPGASTNRSVYTFCASPSAVVEGALQAARAARKLINMAKHRGKHFSGVCTGVFGKQILPLLRPFTL